MLLYIFQGTKVCNQKSRDLNINSTHFSSNITLPSILILYIYTLTVNQQLTHLCLLLFQQRNFKRNICDKVDAKALADGCNKPTDSKADKCSKCSDFAAWILMFLQYNFLRWEDKIILSTSVLRHKLFHRQNL